MNLSVELVGAGNYADVDLTLDQEVVADTYEQGELIRVL